ncbi:MAG: hypothetical protein ACT4O9_07345 [Blastocatellia bacterium]
MTLDLDEDVEFGICKILKDEPDKSFEQIVNELFRIGFAESVISDDSENLTA